MALPQVFSKLTTRSIIPFDYEGPDYTLVSDLPNPKNVQGDVYIGFPKAAEYLIFFEITDSTRFKQDLRNFKPTSSYDLYSVLREINKVKERGDPGARYSNVLYQLAFSREGLNTLGITDKTGDKYFDKITQLDDEEKLMETGSWESSFVGSLIHGVFLIATSDVVEDPPSVAETIANFKSSISVIGIERGKTLPDHIEHFGYRDGISQPALRGLVRPNPGQLECDPGVIIHGYKGDPEHMRPSWTKDGSMMVFRKLEQDVDGWNNYVKEQGEKWKEWASQEAKNQKPELTNAEWTALWGAHLFGRWKSGAPLPIAHFRDDKDLGHDNQRNNNFGYDIGGRFTDRYCPFNAHIRKTAPRDLSDAVPTLSPEQLEANLIVRAGIPYGDRKEIGIEIPPQSRGLLFVCYQSSIHNGFIVQQKKWSSNKDFAQPKGSLLPVGLDPITGTEQGDSALPNSRFVTTRGGEYFFVPSISTLKSWSADS